MREITSRRMTACAMPVTVEERSAFLRVTRDQIADLVGKAIGDISRARMQKGRDIGDLLRGKRRKRRHPPLRPPVSDNGADHITLVVVEHQSRAHKIWPALPMSIIAVTKSARGHKNLPPAFCRFFVDRRPAHQRGNRIARIFLLRSVLRLPIRRLLLLCLGRLIGLRRAYRSKQKQTRNSTEVAMGHSVSPRPHDFRFFTYS